jgi:Cu-Zn family superoxide dismutase
MQLRPFIDIQSIGLHCWKRECVYKNSTRPAGNPQTVMSLFSMEIIDVERNDMNRSATHRPLWLSTGLAVILLSAMAVAREPVKVVHLQDSTGASVGTATIRQHKEGVRIHLDLMNLPPGLHAIHFHETASCTPPDFKSAGGHFNPTGAHHGLHNPQGPHAGDMENITVEANGTSHQTVLDERVTLAPGQPNSLFANGGTALVIHAKEDDMMSDPAGNAGARIACGVITP